MKITVTPPGQLTRQHVYVLSKEEVISAVRAYVEGQGEKVPVGATFVWGLDHTHHSNKETISLVVDAIA